MPRATVEVVNDEPRLACITRYGVTVHIELSPQELRVLAAECVNVADTLQPLGVPELAGAPASNSMLADAIGSLRRLSNAADVLFVELEAACFDAPSVTAADVRRAVAAAVDKFARNA